MDRRGNVPSEFLVGRVRPRLLYMLSNLGTLSVDVSQ